MPEGDERRIKLFFYSLFVVEILLLTYFNYIQNFAQGEVARFLIVEASNLVFLLLGVSGIDRGVDSLLKAFEELKKHPSVLYIYFYAQMFSLMLLLGIIAVLYLLIVLEMYMRAFIIVFPVFMVYLFSTSILSSITKGAMALHLVKDFSAWRSVILSSRKIPAYIMLKFYSLLFKSSGFIARKLRAILLPGSVFTADVISEGADIMLSYATFYIAFGDSSTLAVKKSIESTVENIEETAFLNLGLEKVILISTIFLIVPIALFFGVFLLTWESLGGSAVIVASIPFLVGLTAFLYFASVPVAAGEIALLREIVEKE